MRSGFPSAATKRAAVSVVIPLAAMSLIMGFTDIQSGWEGFGLALVVLAVAMAVDYAIAGKPGGDAALRASDRRVPVLLIAGIGTIIAVSIATGDWTLAAVDAVLIPVAVPTIAWWNKLEIRRATPATQTGVSVRPATLTRSPDASAKDAAMIVAGIVIAAVCAVGAALLIFQVTEGLPFWLAELVATVGAAVVWMLLGLKVAPRHRAVGPILFATGTAAAWYLTRGIVHSVSPYYGLVSLAGAVVAASLAWAISPHRTPTPLAAHRAPRCSVRPHRRIRAGLPDTWRDAHDVRQHRHVTAGPHRLRRRFDLSLVTLRLVVHGPGAHRALTRFGTGRVPVAAGV